MYRRNKAVVEVQFVEAKEAEIPRKLKLNLEWKKILIIWQVSLKYVSMIHLINKIRKR